MQLGALEYLISIKDNNIQGELNKSEEKVRKWGDKLSAWTIAKGQMIARLGEKVGKFAFDAVKNTIKGAVDAFGRYEQISEGAKLVWGDAYSYIESRAKKAYANVQMSAVDYMEQANYYAVGLKNSLNGDTEAAAKLADSIITAQADIVAALGIDAERVQSAFTGIMRGNYTMLDNLGLGIAGTKQGMEDVIKAVNDWNRANHVEKQYNMKSIADQQEALVKYVEMQGLAGYAQREGAETLQGSIASAKAAWQDLMTNIGRGKNIKQAAKNFAEAAKKTIENIRPVVKDSIKGIAIAVKELLPVVKEVAGEAINTLGEALFGKHWPIIVDFVKGTVETVQTFIDYVEAGFKAAVQFGYDITWDLAAFFMKLRVGYDSLIEFGYNLSLGLASFFAAVEDGYHSLIEFGHDLSLGLASFIANVEDGYHSAVNFIVGTAEEVVKFVADSIEIARQSIVDFTLGVVETVDKYIEEISKPINVAVNFVKGAVSSVAKDATVAVGESMGWDGGVLGDLIDYILPNAKGNWSVPYDNYPALLHRGEMVLNKSQARQFRDGETDYSTIGSMIGDAVSAAMSKVYVMMSGEKVGDLTTRRVKNNINASSYSRLRAYGG